MSGLAVGLALLAAALFALASVTQQHSAAAVPDDQAHGLRLIRTLIHRPLWWLGISGNVGGYVAQAAALAVGSLLLVQPLLVTTLLFALPLSARWAEHRLRAADWAWAVLLAAALAVFVVAGDPTAGIPQASVEQWLPTGAVIMAVLAGCLIVAAGQRGTTRAVLLAIATGVIYGVTAATTKAVVSLFSDGPAALLTSWETYVLVATGIGGTLLRQAAFQAGELTSSLPTVTVGESVVAIVIGITVLQEQIRSTGAEWVLIAVVVAVMVIATTALARSAARFDPSVLGPSSAAGVAP